MEAVLWITVACIAQYFEEDWFGKGDYLERHLPKTPAFGNV